MSCGVSERPVETRAVPAGGCRLRSPTPTASKSVVTTVSASASAPTTSTAAAAAAASGETPGNGLRQQRPCCFCWCCCCSSSWSRFLRRICSWATNKGDDGPTRNPNNSDVLNCDGEPPPTLEEIRSWGKSFDKLMKNSAGRKVFRDFLRCEYSEENILFWLACEELKRETNPDAVEEKARFIYEDYISILSPKEVSLDSRVREIVNRNMVEPTPHTFDEAQLQIYTLMHRDSYPRFVNSQLFKNLAQNQDETGDEGATGPKSGGSGTGNAAKSDG